MITFTTVKGLTVDSRNDAWLLLSMLTTHAFEYDSFRSARTGYPIFTDTDVDYDYYVCDLGDRLELNSDGLSQNIWIRNKG